MASAQRGRVADAVAASASSSVERHLRLGAGEPDQADGDLVDLGAGVAEQALVDVADLLDVDVAEARSAGPAARCSSATWTARSTSRITRSLTARRRVPRSVRREQEGEAGRVEQRPAVGRQPQVLEATRRRTAPGRWPAAGAR